MDRANRRRNRRTTAGTARMSRPLPPAGDPIWRLGHEVVGLVADYVLEVTA